MENFLKAVSDYFDAMTGEESEDAVKECEAAFAELVRKYAPRQSYGLPQ